MLSLRVNPQRNRPEGFVSRQDLPLKPSGRFPGRCSMWNDTLCH
jgi:hypothetical protein